MTCHFTPFQLEVTHLTAGWLTCEVAVGEELVTLRASYLSDAVEDLARAVTVLLKGADRAACAWAEEPGEYRWVFEREKRAVRLKILWFDETFSRQENQHGECLIQTVCDPYRIGRQVRDQLRLLRSRYGMDGYEERWRHPFPTAALDELERLTVPPEPRGG